MKLTVFERSTGKEKLEEWLYIPKETFHRQKIWFLRNLAIFVLYPLNTNSNTITDDVQYLILELNTRKEFWMRRAIIANEIREATDCSDLNDFRIIGFSYFRSILVVKCQMTNIHTTATLGGFQNTNYKFIIKGLIIKFYYKTVGKLWIFFPQIRGTSQTVLWKFYPNILQRSDFRGASQTALWKLFRRSPNLSSLNRSLSTTRTPEPCQRVCRIRLSPRSISKEEWTPSL